MRAAAAARTSALPLPPSGVASYDDPFAEVVDYADGFAKIVHAAQQLTADPLAEKDDGTRPVKETGIRLGWDDEQVTIWLNRQIDPALADQTRRWAFADSVSTRGRKAIPPGTRSAEQAGP